MVLCRYASRFCSRLVFLLKGSSTHRMRWAFYDTYEKGDLRLNTIVAEYVNNKGKKVKRGDKNLSQGALPFKYDQDPTTNGNFAKNDIVVLRYAEAILAYAEAINETEGPTKQAIDLLNLVRKRAGLKGIETIDNGDKVSSKEAFRDAILEERGMNFIVKVSVTWTWFVWANLWNMANVVYPNMLKVDTMKILIAVYSPLTHNWSSTLKELLSKTKPISEQAYCTLIRTI